MSDSDKTKVFKRCNSDYFFSTCEKLGVTPKELCLELGYSKGVYFDWRKSGYMPKVARIACEGLLRRFNKEGAPSNVLCIIGVPMDKVELLETFCKGMGAKMIVSVSGNDLQ